MIEYRQRATARQWWLDSPPGGSGSSLGNGKGCTLRISQRGLAPPPDVATVCCRFGWRCQRAGRPLITVTGRYTVSNYLCSSWQGFLQQVVYQVSRGYVYYCIVEYPEKKRDKWSKTDTKLIQKYQADLSKDQRYRRKAKQLANFMFLRWDKWSVILHTAGEIEGVHYDDKFHGIEGRPLELRLNLGYRIHKGAKGEVTVHLTSESYRGVKAALDHAISSRRQNLLVDEFNRLNGLPCWGGIVEQKSQLLEHILRKAGKCGIKVERSDFRFLTKRKVYDVFEK